jgi:hypothetical protein
MRTKWAVYIPSEKKMYLKNTDPVRPVLWWSHSVYDAKNKAQHVGGRVVDAEWIQKNFAALIAGDVQLPPEPR